MKNINRLLDGNLKLKKSEVYYNRIFKVPNMFFLTKYLINFYSNLISKLYYLLIYKLFSIRSNCWSLFIGEGIFMKSNLFRLNEVLLPKNKFWADPFLFKKDNKTYVFFENYDYKQKKGKISCGVLINKNIHNVIDVLDFTYHLSYPSIFENDNKIFMIPETFENNRLEIYICDQFPKKWNLYSTAFDGIKVSDVTFYCDKLNQKWLFLTKHDKNGVPKNAELYIYKIDSLKLNDIKPHKNNPVLIDSRYARCAGPIFEKDGEIYRPSQGNVDGIYGKYLNINKIKKLTLDDYIEENIKVIKPNFKDGLTSTHHLHQIDDMFIIDAAYKLYI